MTAEQKDVTRLFTSATRVQKPQSPQVDGKESQDTSHAYPTETLNLSLSSSGLGHRLFTASTGVQIPAGTPLPDFYPALAARIRAGLEPDPDRPGCLAWRGAASGKGYGRLRFAGRLYSPHRVMLEQKVGRLLERREDTRHGCDNPRCCNPDHLEPGSRHDNVHDARARGRLKSVAKTDAGKERIRESNRRRQHPTCFACGRFLSAGKCVSDWCPDGTAEDDDTELAATPVEGAARGGR